MKRDWLPKLPAEQLVMACGLGSIHEHLQELFHRGGDELLARCKEHGWLHPDDRVLDLDCRAGRLAHALLDEPITSYDGLYWDRIALDWCTTEISRRDRRFRFHWFDLALAARTGAVPDFADESFDFVMLDSILTRTDFETTRGYLRVLARMMAPGGRMIADVYYAIGKAYTLPGLSFFNQREFLALVDSVGLAHEQPDGPYTDRVANWLVLTKRG
jgi:hypothetical protein